MPSTSLPVYVMLPLDTIWLLERDGKSVRVIPPFTHSGSEPGAAQALHALFIGPSTKLIFVRPSHACAYRQLTCFLMWLS